MRKALVLLSGGQDSTTCLYWAKTPMGKELRDGGGFDEIHALTLAYGQRHAAEIGAAAHIAIKAGVASHEVVQVPVLAASGSALVDTSKELTADGGYADAHAPGGLPSSFVPGRNLVFLALAAAKAAALGCEAIVTGVCQTDYSGYPDCRQEFIDAMEHAVNFALPSGMPHLAILTPLMNLTKAETVNMAAAFPGCWDALALSTTCYHGRRPGCGECPACTLRAKGFAEAGFQDPSAYQA